MRSALALVFILSAGSPALACHHYRSWSYPWRQSCKVTSAKPVHHRAWFVDVVLPPASPPAPAPAPVVEAPVVNPEVIETLNEELLWRAANSLTLEEKRNGD